MTTREDCLAMDRDDPLAQLRRRYQVPEGMIYLDGNSLGLMPKSAEARVLKAVRQEWGEDLITSWNKHGWFKLPQVCGNKIARLIGGGHNNVVVADTISVNLFKVLSAALALRPNRHVVLSDTGDFPSDLYVAQGLAQFVPEKCRLHTAAPESVIDAITENVAVVMLTDVDYRTSRRHDMQAITAKAHAMGALVIWDLAHSAGVLPVDLLGVDADFAVGCTYKYLNGGPGAPAFLFVHPRWQNESQPALVGWWGHANPFAFDTVFTPVDGIGRYQCGTQGILSLQALDAALDEWRDVDMQAVAAKSAALCQVFIETVTAQCGKHGLRLAGPANNASRGSHVSFHCAEGYAVMQALVARRVIGDFRAPDMIRFGFAPVYNTFIEAYDAALVLADVLATRAWDRPQFLARKAVT
jgi:kynureninase